MRCERWFNEVATVHADITADHRDATCPVVMFSSFYSTLPTKGQCIQLSARRHYFVLDYEPLAY